MGNCCGAEGQKEHDMNMARDYHGTKIPTNLEHLFDNREILGLRGRDKLYIIVRI